jgi:cytochrome c
MYRLHHLGIALIGVLAVSTTARAQTGDPARGERVFRACAACHSLEPNRNMTGPSLSELWNRKAGTLPSFERYSPALTSSGIVWDDRTLDDWISDPEHFISGNTMTFPGVEDARQRADLLAFLREVTRPGHAPTRTKRDNRMGGMMGMMGGGAVPNLKKLEPDERVAKITHCRDTYRVTTEDGKTRAFWERNLRLMTDASDRGPEKNAPVIVAAGMMADRADVIFASPEEISGFIASAC